MQGHLPRLPREKYQGHAVVMWTLTLERHAKGWLSDSFHQSFREMMLHAAARESLLCPAYCLMPDHMHFAWMGLCLNSDQLNGMKFLRRYLAPALTPDKFQQQLHDHVLTEEERKRGAFASVCFYIRANPVRAELVKSECDWKYSGAVIPGYPTLHPSQEDYWEQFWKVYLEQRSCGGHTAG